MVLIVVFLDVCLFGIILINGKIYIGWNGWVIINCLGCDKLVCNFEGIIFDVFELIVVLGFV